MAVDQNEHIDDGLMSVLEKMEFSDGAHMLRLKEGKSLNFTIVKDSITSSADKQNSPGKYTANLRNSLIEQTQQNYSE